METNEDFNLSKYREVLQAYKEINNMLSSTMPTEKEILEQQELSQYLKNQPKVKASEKDTSKEARDNNQEKIDKNEIENISKKIEEKENELRIKENELLNKENKLKDQEQILLKLASQLKIKEKQLQDQELSLAAEILNIENQNLKQREMKLSIETFDNITFIPETIQEETKTSNENQIEELKGKIKELEEMNEFLNTKNQNIEEELSRVNDVLNEQKYKIVKETERLITKGNSLKVREQTLASRENKLVESTKFINTAIASMNQLLKAKAKEEEENKTRITHTKSLPGSELRAEDLTFRGFVRNLHEIKDFSNVPNQGNRTVR